MENKIRYINFDKELTFSSSRSSGPGGQHVNKVNTRIELRFNVFNSQLLSEHQKSMLKVKLKSFLSGNGDLIISSQTQRSQLRNKETAKRKFYFLIEESLKELPERKPTKPTMSSRLRKRKNKIRISEKKKLRKKPDL